MSTAYRNKTSNKRFVPRSELRLSGSDEEFTAFNMPHIVGLFGTKYSKVQDTRRQFHIWSDRDERYFSRGISRAKLRAPIASTDESFAEAKEWIVYPAAKKKVAKVDMSNSRIYELDTIVRVNAILIGLFALFCLVGGLFSGTTLIHPLIGTMLLIASISFYLMTCVKANK